MRIAEIIIHEALEGQKAKRGDFIKLNLGSKWQGVEGFADFDQFIERLAEIDPSPNGAFMQWMARVVIKDPNQNKPEDLPRLADDLKYWTQFKSQLPNKNIDSYKSFEEVYNAIAPFLKPKVKSKEDRAREREEAKVAAAKGEVITVYKGAEGWIRIPTTKNAAKFLGQGTRWCTAAKRNNVFDQYDERDRLFIVYNKADQTRYQLHIQSGQFADEADKMQGMNAVPSWARTPIIRWYKENNPDLSLAHLMTLTAFDQESSKELVDDTHEHAGLLDLMRQYGV